MRPIASMFRILAAVWLLGVASVRSQAADCDWGSLSTASEARIRLSDFGTEGCLIAPNCRTPLCTRVAALRSPTGEGVASVLKAIQDSLAEALPTDYPGVSQMKARLETWRTRVLDTPADRLPVAEWQVSGRTVFAGEDDEVVFGSAIESRMQTLHTTAGAEFALAATQMRMALLVDQALRALLAPARDTYVARLQSLDRRWQSYVRDSRSSFPWEWALNDLVFDRKQQDGFEAPRTRQIVLLHPDAAYQYVAVGGDRLSESLTLEVLGLARYKWGTDDKLKGRLSGSAFVGWRGNTKETPFWGLMAHLAHGGSVGVGVRSREKKAEWGVFASGDVGKLFLANGDARAEVVRAELLKRLAPQP